MPELKSVTQVAGKHWLSIASSKQYISFIRVFLVFSLVLIALVLLVTTLNLTLAATAMICLYVVLAALAFSFYFFEIEVEQSEVIAVMFGVGLSAHHIVAVVFDYSK